MSGQLIVTLQPLLIIIYQSLLIAGRFFDSSLITSFVWR